MEVGVRVGGREEVAGSKAPAWAIAVVHARGMVRKEKAQGKLHDIACP